MKTSINLIQAPNQTLSANITDINGEIHIVDINLRTLYDGQMIADISIDGTAVFYLSTPPPILPPFIRTWAMNIF